MRPYYEEAGIQIFHGDCHSLPLPDASVDCCVTSPPYWGLRDYGIPRTIWGGDLGHGHVWGEPITVNATNHTDKRRWNHARNGRGEEQPKEKRVAWLRTDVDQGSFCECGAWRGVFGLEPTPEMYVEHSVWIFREVRRVLRDDGTLWLNLGDSYATGAGKVGDSPGGGEQGERWKGGRGTHTASNSGKHGPSLAEMGPRTQPNRMPIAGLKPKDLVGIPWRVVFALQADGWYLRSDIIWNKPNPMPESVTDRPTRAHEYIFLLAKAERYYYDADAIAEAATCDRKRGPALHADRVSTNGNAGLARRDSGGVRNKRSVWTVMTQPYPEAHFATFPEDLIRPCILAGCPQGGTVLDPFGGSGTTIQVARALGCRGVMVELNAAYCEMAANRLRQRVFDYGT